MGLFSSKRQPGGPEEAVVAEPTPNFEVLPRVYDWDNDPDYTTKSPADTGSTNIDHDLDETSGNQFSILSLAIQGAGDFAQRSLSVIGMSELIEDKYRAGSIMLSGLATATVCTIIQVSDVL